MKLGRMNDALPPESPRPERDEEPLWIVTRHELRTTRTLWMADSAETAEKGEGRVLAALHDGVSVTVEPARALREVMESA